MHSYYYFNLRNTALTGKNLVLLKCMSLILNSIMQMQVVSMGKMIVLIILPVPLNKKVDRNTGQYPFFQNHNITLHIEMLHIDSMGL